MRSLPYWTATCTHVVRVDAIFAKPSARSATLSLRSGGGAGFLRPVGTGLTSRESSARVASCVMPTMAAMRQNWQSVIVIPLWYASEWSQNVLNVAQLRCICRMALSPASSRYFCTSFTAIHCSVTLASSSSVMSTASSSRSCSSDEVIAHTRPSGEKDGETAFLPVVLYRVQ